MDTEWEAKFLDIDKEHLRKKLQDLGAKLVKPETLYKRSVFFLPTGHAIEGGWLRVRDEGDKITMSLKVTANGKIDAQKEVMVEVDNYDKAYQLLTEIGCVMKAYQETKREIWELNGVEITLDEWPYLEPYLEIEGESEDVVKGVAEKLGFDYAKAVFGAADQVISKKYNIPEEVINDKIPRIVFNEENPYLKWSRENNN
jgi:adenylate cyclase class 2